jgi:uncharacterized membrane protein
VLTHPLVVHFPIALWLASTLFDVIAWRRPESPLKESAYWLVGLGLAAALVSIALGWADLLSAERQGVGTALLIRHRVHSVVAYAATAAYLGNFAWRWRSYNKPGPGFLVLSLVGAALIAVTGYLGGTLREVM